MISKTLRMRLAYTAMSVFAVWHTLALVVAPAPPASLIAQRSRVLLQPYLSLLRLDNPWNFFAAADAGRMSMSQFRYAVEDKAGEKHTFMPEADFRLFDPAYFWFRGWYNAIIDNPEDYADIAGAWYCQKRASLSPVSVTLLEMQEKDFTRTDFLAGKDRWATEFVTVNTIKSVKCPVE
jgi:hypothetical protein